MQSSKIIMAFLVAWLLVGCEKSISPNPINFDVDVLNNAGAPALKFKVNDTVNFRFIGNPDRITFFSGELGRRYAYRNRASDPSPDVTLTFLSQLNRAGAGQLQLLLSTDSIVYTQYNKDDAVAIPAANWTDISSRATWPTTAGSTNVPSGAISLNQEASAGTGKIWLAFKYTAPARLSQRAISITNPQIVHKLSDASYTILTPAVVVPASFPAFVVSPGWGSVNVANPLIKWSFTGGSTGNANFGQSSGSNGATTGFGLSGNANATAAVATENWLLAGPINLKRVLPDAGVAVKNKGENAENIFRGFYSSPTANYTHRFTTAGTYEVVFVAHNDTEAGQNSIIKTITIEVTN